MNPTQKILTPVGVTSKDRISLRLDETATKFVARIYGWQEHLNAETFASNNAANRFPARVPERKKLSNGSWEFAATDITAQLVRANFRAEQIVVDAEAQLTLRYLLATADGYDRAAQQVAIYKTTKQLRDSLRANWRQSDAWFCVASGYAPQLRKSTPELEDSPELPLAEYQRYAANNVVRNEGYGLFMKQGTGKTPVVIAAICNATRRLRQGWVDDSKQELDRSTILKHAETTFQNGRREILEGVEKSIERKREKLKNAAKKRAAKRQVSLDYTGSAEMLLRKAQEAVREAEVWLNNRLRQIENEMVELAVAMRAEADRAVARLRESIDASSRHQISKLTASVVKGENRMYRALIVAPKNVRANWDTEFKRFATRPCRVTVLRGGQMKRARLLIDALAKNDGSECTVVVVSYETMARMIDTLCAVTWDFVGLDESHYIKSPNTQRTKAALRLRDHAAKRAILTGTPVANTALDVYSQLEFLGKGWSGFMAWKNFREFYGVYDRDANGHKSLVDVQNLPFMKERLARLSFVITKEEALPDLPDKVYDVVEIEMGPRQTEVYEALRDKLVAEINSMMSNSTQTAAIVINNVLTKLLRLAQVTSGYAVSDLIATDEDGDDPKRVVEVFSPNPKIEALMELLRDKEPQQKTIVWACFRHDIEAISARLKSEGIKHVTFTGSTSEAEREDAVRLFNEDRDTKVFLGNAGAGGTGVNLLGYPPGRPDETDTRCDHEIYYSQDWSYTKREQSEDRAHRRGTKTNVRITDLCVPNTIDEQIRARVVGKKMKAIEIADVREILSNVLKGELTSDE